MTSRSPSHPKAFAADAVLQAQPAHPFVSRGGVKLTGALERYPIDIEDHVCLDVGASTGGFTEVLLANGASLVFAIDVGREQLHPSLRGHPKIVSMEETDIRGFEGKRLPMRPDIVVIDVSFISLKAVLPVALSLAAAPMHLLALIKPQFEAPRKHSKRGIVRDADGAPGSLRRHRGVRGVAGMHRHQGVSVADHGRRRQHRILHRRAPWLNALLIDHVGHRGDGVAFADGQTVFVPYTLGGETVEVAPVPGIIPTAGGCCGSSAPAPSGSRRSARISASAAAARSSIGEPRAYRAWKRGLVVETLAQAGSTARSTDSSMPTAPAAGASPFMPAAAATAICSGRLCRGQRATPSSRSIDCPILDPGLRGALDAAWALAELLKPTGKPLDIQVTATEQRPRRRCPRLRAAAASHDRNAVARSPSNIGWRG